MASCLSEYQRRVDKTDADCNSAISDIEDSSGSDDSNVDTDAINRAVVTLMDETDSVIADIDSHIRGLEAYRQECTERIYELRRAYR